MADKKDDKKKDFKKDDKKESSGNSGEDVFIIVFVLVLVGVLVMRIVAFFTPSDTGTGGEATSAFELFTGGPNGWFANFLHFLQVFVNGYVTIATIFSIVTFLTILYVVWLTHKLYVEEKKKKTISEVVEELPSLQKQRWQRVLAHANSQNPAEWRLSILEADVMLDDMMQWRGFHGETLGERLKNTSRADFKTIDTAWEAHKIRNAIAHEGSDFLLSQRESRRIIGLYEVVLKEFSYI